MALEKQIPIAQLFFILMLACPAAWSNENTLTTLRKEVSRCRMMSEDTYVDYKTADQRMELKVDKSQCSRVDGKIKVSMDLRNVLFRGGMDAAAPHYGMYSKESDKFVPFTLATDPEAIKTEQEMKKQFEAMPGAETQKKEDKAWKFIGQTYAANLPLIELPCKPGKTTSAKGEIWLTTMSQLEKDKKTKPFEGTFVIDWNASDIYNSNPKLDIKITHSPKLCESYQFILPTADTRKMRNSLFNPIGYPCYKVDAGDINETGKNMNDIVSYMSRNPKPGDSEEFYALYLEYINKNGIDINKDRFKAKEEK